MEATEIKKCACPCHKMLGVFLALAGIIGERRTTSVRIEITGHQSGGQLLCELQDLCRVIHGGHPFPQYSSRPALARAR